MANTYKVLALTALSADTNTDIYTVPAATSAIISAITVANTTASGITYRLAITGSATAASAVTLGEHVAYDVAVAANDTVSLNLGLTLEAAKKIVARANSASVSFGVFGSEVS